MPWVGFEPTNPAFQRAKTVHPLDRAATVIGNLMQQMLKYNIKFFLLVSDVKMLVEG
jgi:hypothetical protein